MNKKSLIDITKVIITDDHWDRDISNTDGLKESISENGLIQPIVITESHELVAGYRRLTFAKELGWTEIPCFFLGDLSPLERKTLELEENIRRKDLSWSEKDLQIAELHALKVSIHGERERGNTKSEEERDGWGIKKTAEIANISNAAVSRSLKIAEAIKEDPSLAEETSQRAALAKLKRREIQEINRILASRITEESLGNIQEGEAHVLLKGLKDESINAIITDIPYNANVDEVYNTADGRMSQEESAFQDDEDFIPYMKDIRDELFRVLAFGSHIWMFCGFDQVVPLRDYYSEKFNVRHLPIIWDKVARGYAPTPEVIIPRNYECILFMSKGTKPFNIPVEMNGVDFEKQWGDVFRFIKVGANQKLGINEKPTSILMYMVKLSTSEGDIILDPFCGTGSTLEAASICKRRFIAFDKNPEVLVIAKTRVGKEEERKARMTLTGEAIVEGQENT